MNNKIKILNTDILSDNWYTLKKVTFEYTRQDGSKEIQNREAYDRGNGAVVLLYNKEKKTIILTRQFRLPTFINGNTDGVMIEACAGLLDKDNPEECIKREIEEETGYRLKQVAKIFEVYMSPGSVTEVLHFFLAPYDTKMKINKGGGIEDEEIEVLELDVNKAIEMIYSGQIKDAKTIILIQHAIIKNLV